jgi:hypothetical protein
MCARPILACSLATLVLSLAAPANAQIVVVPWAAGASDTSIMRSTADAVTLAIPESAGSVVSISETRMRFESQGSSDAPTVTSAELEQWTAFSRQAVRDLANEDYAAAREALRHAQEISDRAAAEMTREEARARQVLDTCLYGVRAYIEQHDPHAEEQLMGCRRLVPRIAPSANIHTPEVVELLTRIDRRLADAHRGPLAVESQPSGCTVRLNGIAVGTTPFTSEQLAPGEYRVQVECGDSGHGRLHRVTVPDATGPVTLRVDARFDSAIHSDGVLRLTYADRADATAHRIVDARRIGQALGASEVWLVGVSPDGALSGDRVRVEDGATLSSVTGIAGSATALVTGLMTTTSEPVAVETHHGGDVSPGAWALIFGGGAVAIAGAVMLAIGVPDLGAVGSPHTGETVGASAARQSTGEALTGVGAASLGVGVVLAAIGIVLAVGDTSGGGEDAASLRLGPGGAELTLHF